MENVTPIYFAFFLFFVSTRDLLPIKLACLCYFVIIRFAELHVQIAALVRNLFRDVISVIYAMWFIHVSYSCDLFRWFLWAIHAISGSYVIDSCTVLFRLFMPNRFRQSVFVSVYLIEVILKNSVRCANNKLLSVVTILKGSLRYLI